MLIFAEGTRSKDGRLAAFKRGPFYLAKETGAPIVPMVITGTEKMMRKHSAAITPGVARVKFLEAIWPNDFATREELMQAVRRKMIAALPQEMRPVSSGSKVRGCRGSRWVFEVRSCVCGRIHPWGAAVPKSIAAGG